MPLTLPQLNKQPLHSPYFLINANSNVFLHGGMSLKFCPKVEISLLLMVLRVIPLANTGGFLVVRVKLTTSAKLVGSSYLVLQFYIYFCLIHVPTLPILFFNKSFHEHLTSKRRVTSKTRNVQSELKYQVVDRRVKNSPC